jgi:iron uptake system EfeUOB component EfeO/EfeM
VSGTQGSAVAGDREGRLGARFRRHRPASLIGCLFGLTLAVSTTVACSGTAADVAVSSTSCGDSWSLSADGALDTSVRNAGNTVLRVDLVDTSSSELFASITALAPGSSQRLRITLPDGSYHLACSWQSGVPALQSPDRRVSSSKAAHGHPLLLLSVAEMQSAARTYGMQVNLRTQVLARDVTDLATAVRDGDVARQRKLWLTGHTDYLKLGGPMASTATGIAIDGLPVSPGGVQDQAFTGFHRIEYLLWNGGTRAQLEAATARLVTDVTALQGMTRNGGVQTTQLVLSCRTGLQSAADVTLTGRDDFGSHSGLASLAARVEGTRLNVQALTPMLRKRDPGLLSRTESGLADVAAWLDGVRRADGSYPPLSALTAGQRQRLNALVGRQLEVQALIPTTLQVLAAGDPD